jgi:hypothetical protein
MTCAFGKQFASFQAERSRDPTPAGLSQRLGINSERTVRVPRSGVRGRGRRRHGTDFGLRTCARTLCIATAGYSHRFWAWWSCVNQRRPNLRSDESRFQRCEPFYVQ